MFSQIKMKITKLGEMEHLKYLEENRKRVFVAAAAAAAWYFLFSATYLILIRPSIPEEAAKDYIRYLNAKNYGEACECYKNEEGKEAPGKDYIMAALEGLYGHASHMHIKGLVPDGESYRAIIEVREEGASREETISLVNADPNRLGMGKRWMVVFPFRQKDVTVMGVDGSSVFVDGIFAGKIEGGKLQIPHVILGERRLSAVLPDMGRAEELEVEVGEDTELLEIEVKPFEDFKESIDKQVYGFCRVWSNYCMGQDPKVLRPYLTDRLFEEYTGDYQLFHGSRYEICEFKVEPKELSLDNGRSIFYTVDEKWHLKEVITDPELVFEDNNKTELEQTQFISWKYHMVNDGGFWKIDSAEQLAFRQEIKS